MVELSAPSRYWCTVTGGTGGTGDAGGAGIAGGPNGGNGGADGWDRVETRIPIVVVSMAGRAHHDNSGVRLAFSL